MCLQARVVALQELHKAMSRWICLFFNSISKFLNLSFYQNCRKIIVLRFWKGKTSNTTIATCNCNSRNLPLGPLCLRQCFLNPSLSSVDWSDDLPLKNCQSNNPKGYIQLLPCTKYCWKLSWICGKDSQCRGRCDTGEMHEILCQHAKVRDTPINSS